MRCARGMEQKPQWPVLLSLRLPIRILKARDPESSPELLGHIPLTPTSAGACLCCPRDHPLAHIVVTAFLRPNNLETGTKVPAATDCLQGSQISQAFPSLLFPGRVGVWGLLRAQKSSSRASETLDNQWQSSFSWKGQIYGAWK